MQHSTTQWFVWIACKSYCINTKHQAYVRKSKTLRLVKLYHIAKSELTGYNNHQKLQRNWIICNKSQKKLAGQCTEKIYSRSSANFNLKRTDNVGLRFNDIQTTYSRFTCLTYPYFKQIIMYSGLVFFSKIKPDSLLKVQTSHINQFLQNGPLFGVLYKEEKPRDFSLPKNVQLETWCIRTDKSHCMSEYFPPCKGKLFVNFLHKRYQKYINRMYYSTDTVFPIFSWTNTKSI